MLVQIPGVKDKDRALKLVGETAELQFRPVLATYPPPGSASTVDHGEGRHHLDDCRWHHDLDRRDDHHDGGHLDDPARPRHHRHRRAGGRNRDAVVVERPRRRTTTTAAPRPPPPIRPRPPPTASTTTTAPTRRTIPPVTPADQIKRSEPVVLPSKDLKTGKVTAIYSLGPTVLTGSSLSSASADLNQQSQWEIRPVFKSGKTGIDLFNQAASACYSGSSTCPPTASCQGSSGGGTHGALAVVLDNNVLTAPAICNASFQRDQITISGYLQGERGQGRRDGAEVRRAARGPDPPAERDRVGHPRPRRPPRRSRRRRRGLRPGRAST